jgi:hypothetical protein
LLQEEPIRIIWRENVSAACKQNGGFLTYLQSGFSLDRDELPSGRENVCNKNGGYSSYLPRGSILDAQGAAVCFGGKMSVIKMANILPTCHVDPF